MALSQWVLCKQGQTTGTKFWLLALALMAPAFLGAEDKTDTAIRAVLEQQVADWNRGDVTAFVMSYAEDCVFVGTGVTEGRAQVEERYRRTYTSPAAMGQLAFSNLKIRKINGRVALVTGTYRLQRSAAGGGDKSGIFSLVFKRRKRVWRIALDHTS